MGMCRGFIVFHCYSTACYQKQLHLTRIWGKICSLEHVQGNYQTVVGKESSKFKTGFLMFSLSLNVEPWEYLLSFRTSKNSCLDSVVTVS